MNIGKKYKQYNKTKRKAKITSIILILFILMSNTLATNALTEYENDSQTPNDINTSFEVAQTSTIPLATEATSTTTKSISVNDEFNVVCSLNNITSFNRKSFKITYNPTQVQLLDFAAQASKQKVSVGLVANTDLEILTHSTTKGELTFQANKTITAGQMWSGAVTVLRFKAKTTGTTTITYGIEEEYFPYDINAEKGLIIIPSNTTISTLLENGIVSITDKNGGVYTGTYVGTSAKVQLASGNTLTVVVYGDVTGTGTVSSGDVTLIYRHLRGVSNLNGEFLIAAKVTAGGGAITSGDVTATYRYLRGIITSLPLLSMSRRLSVSGTITFTFEADKTSVSVGDEITYTIKMSSAAGIGLSSFDFEITLPENLELKLGSTKLSTTATALSFSSIDFDEAPKFGIFSQGGNYDYTGAGMDIGKFTCIAKKAGSNIKPGVSNANALDGSFTNIGLYDFEEITITGN